MYQDNTWNTITFLYDTQYMYCIISHQCEKQLFPLIIATYRRMGWLGLGLGLELGLGLGYG